MTSEFPRIFNPNICKNESKWPPKLWIIIIFLLGMLIGSVARGEWRELPPTGNKTVGGNRYLNDLVNHTRPPYPDPDLVTYGHETTHSVNSDARSYFKCGQALYVFNNKCFVVQVPKFKLNDLANKIVNRGQIFQLYLIDSQRAPQGMEGWNDNPTYPMDEMVAYSNGCIVGLEAGMVDRVDQSFQRSCELQHYCSVLETMSGQDDIRQFNAWHKQRLKIIKSKFTASAKSQGYYAQLGPIEDQEPVTRTEEPVKPKEQLFEVVR